MKKILALFLLFLGIITVAERLDVGKNNLMKGNRVIISSDTLGPGDTLQTIIYNISKTKGMSGNHSVWFQADSLRDSIVLEVKLFESWDAGATWVLDTSLITISYGGSTIDTAIDCSLFPSPDFKLMFINNGDGTDSFELEKGYFYANPR